MEKPEATKDDVGALIERFHAPLKGANSHTAPPAKVKAFEEALGTCVKADVLSKCNLETPLGAALDTTLHMAEKTAGPAVPLIWEEQAGGLRDELGHRTAPLLERMLIEHIVLCYFRLMLAEMQLSAVSTHGGPVRQIEHHDRMATAAQKRFNRAGESLDRVRRLARPSVQINVAAEGAPVERRLKWQLSAVVGRPSGRCPVLSKVDLSCWAEGLSALPDRHARVDGCPRPRLRLDLERPAHQLRPLPHAQ
jgi:hypothetical protein